MGNKIKKAGKTVPCHQKEMTIDTNILIAHLQGDEAVIKALSIWKLSGRVLLISSIVRAEVLSRPDLTDPDIYEILKFLGNFSSVPFDDRIAEYAGKLRRAYRITLPDAGIAATALYHNTALVTRNQKDFTKIAGLQIVSI